MVRWRAVADRPITWTSAAHSFFDPLVELCFANIKLALNPPPHLILDFAAAKQADWCNKGEYRGFRGVEGG
jgi:hypothetical protein